MMNLKSHNATSEEMKIKEKSKVIAFQFHSLDDGCARDMILGRKHLRSFGVHIIELSADIVKWDGVELAMRKTHQTGCQQKSPKWFRKHERKPLNLS